MTGLDSPALFAGLDAASYVEIVADVPWPYRTRTPRGLGRSAERHYRTMPLPEIAALPVAAYAARNARLWFWVTGPFLAEAAHVPIMNAWGFVPVAISHVWLKPIPSKYRNGQLFLDEQYLFKIGMGHTTRQNVEYVVLGRRGHPPKRFSASERQIIIEPAREHSRKPEKFYRSVERYTTSPSGETTGPRLELFGRAPRPGWVVRGDQVGKFSNGETAG